MPTPIQRDMTRPVASTHARPTYAPGYTSPAPFAGSGSGSVLNARLGETREHISQFAYNTGDASTAAVHTFASQGASEGVDQRPFYPTANQSTEFARPVEILPYGETAEEPDAVKRE